jgi:hypothetical protein
VMLVARHSGASALKVALSVCVAPVAGAAADLFGDLLSHALKWLPDQRRAEDDRLWTDRVAWISERTQ